MNRKNRKNHFENIYEKKLWSHHGNTYSGRGAAPTFVRNLIIYIRDIFKQYDINSIVDICGDFAWQSGFLVDFEGTYMGVDISEKCLAMINKKKVKSNIVFKQMDVCVDPIPSCDLFIAKDVLYHLEEKDVFAFFKNIRKSNVKWLLLTTFFSGGEPTPGSQAGRLSSGNMQADPFKIVFEETFIDNPKIKGYEQKGVGIVSVEKLKLNKVFDDDDG